MEINIQSYKDEFINLLRECNRDGMDDVISDLEEWGFFEAPASAGHHLNVKGGLLMHSLNTYHASINIWEAMKKVEPTLEKEVSRESIIVAALLHDVCKTDIYKLGTRRKKNAMGVWEDVPGYTVTQKNFPMGHGEKSVTLLLCSGLQLTDAEMLAIRWHMGAWGLNFNSYEDQRCFDAAKLLYPLVSIIHAGDSLAAAIMERTPEDIDLI